MQLSTIDKFSKIEFGRAVMAAMMLLTLVVAGCGNGGSGDSAGGAASGAASSLTSGVAHGAFGPIVGATVTAYKAGVTGFGTGAVAITSAITNSKGAFNFTSGTCNTGDAIYYVSRGGNAGGGVNPAIALMSEVGLCENLPNSVTINEVTTVASVYALAQFIGHSSPYPVGTSATNIVGQKNAFANVGNLAIVTTGNARSIPLSGGAGSAPQRNVNTIANALISCVNSSAGSAMCAELFDCAKPGAIFDGGASCSGGTGTTPTDTLGATLNIALNPIRVSVPGIFSAAIISPIFTPALAKVPGTLVLALNPSPPGANFSDPSFVAIDAAGNAWVTNQLSDSVTKLASSGAVVGNFNNTNTPGADFSDPFGLAIDAGGNAWMANFAGSSVTKLTSGGALVGNFNNTNTSGANFAFPVAVAIDAAGNAWVTNDSQLTPSNASVTKLTSSGALVDNFDNTNTPGAGLDRPFDVAVDAAGNVWVTNQATGNALLGSVTKLTGSGGLLGNFNDTNTPGAGFQAPAGMAIDAVGNVWVADAQNNSVIKLTSAGALVGNFNTPGPNLETTFEVAIDGAGNAWVTNFGGGVTELTSNGAIIGSITFVNTPGTNFKMPGGVAIDSAGNVWVANASNNTVTEMVGAARPVRTPEVACLKLSPPHAVCLP